LTGAVNLPDGTLDSKTLTLLQSIVGLVDNYDVVGGNLVIRNSSWIYNEAQEIINIAAENEEKYI